MSRLMSVAFTEQAVRERRKTVTRRKGWLMLKAGDRLTLCRKVMGRKPGEPLDRICDVGVVSVRREPFNALMDAPDLGKAELRREGFTNIGAVQFWERYFAPQGIGLLDEVTRIEWRYLDVTRERPGRVFDTNRGFATKEEAAAYEAACFEALRGLLSPTPEGPTT